MTDRPTPTRPRVIVLGGCNGAGKTTSSRHLLTEALDTAHFVNADSLARGLSGFAPETFAMEASRIMLGHLRALVERRWDFSFETTLAARTYAGMLREWKSLGYRVELVYFWLNSPDLAVARVAHRVATGGHHVPENDIRTRYRRSVRNFSELYVSLCDGWRVYDNTEVGTPVEIAERGADGSPVILDRRRWAAFEESSR